MSATAVTGSAAAPLSVAQEALWYASVLAPTQCIYNETISFRKDGAFDLDAFRRAFNEIVRRHEAWRTVFDVLDGEPVQIVCPPTVFELGVLDLAHLTLEEAERRAARVVAEVSRVPYDVRRGPLVRPRLVRFPGEQHRLYMAMHHLVFDGVSVYRVVLSELVTLYEAFCAGLESPLPEPATHYADYARWEQSWIDEPRARRRIDYWRAHLETATDLALPLDRPRPAERRARGGVVDVTVPGECVERLRDVAQRAGATVFQALATTWALLLHRYSGQNDVVFATPVDLRVRPEFTSVVGYCLTPAPLRADVSGDPTFADLLTRVRNEVLDALDHVVPFERLVRELRPEAPADVNPIYQAMIVLEPQTPAPEPSWSIHQMETAIASAVGSSKVDLELGLDERPEGHLEGRLIYDSDLFEPDTAARMAAHWVRVVEAVAADPDVRASRIALLSAEEERRLTVEWNATATHRRGAALHELVRERWARDPDAPVVSAAGESVSAAELDDRADRRLAAPGDVVPLAGEVSAELIAGALGAMRNGAGFAVRDRTLSPRVVADVAAALADELGLGPADTVLVLPSERSPAGVLECWAPLVAGARIVVAPEDAARDGSQLRRLIKAESVSFLHARPSTWQALIDTGLRSSRSLVAMTSGEPLTRALADLILERFRVLWNAHGAPELAGVSTLGRVERSGPVTIGRPIANARASVVDGHGRLVPIGVAGELVLAGEDRATVRTGDLARWRSDGNLELVPAREHGWS